MSPSLPSLSLPGTERSITRIGLGGMPLSLAGRPDRETAKSVIRTAIEAGITLIDTADAYAVDHTDIGHNERLIAEAFREMGLSVEDGPVVVATKGGRTRPDGEWDRDGRPEHLREACEASLKALESDRITLYQYHSPDPRVPFSDSIGELSRLREEGKVETVGLSNVTVAQIEEAGSMVPIASVQNAQSVWDVGYTKSPVVEYCRRHGIVFLAYAPLGGSGRASRLGESAGVSRLSAELGASPQELALAWLLHQAPVVVPIPGASRTSSVLSSVKAGSLELDVRTLRRLTSAFRTLPGHRSFLQRVASKLKRVVGG